METYESAIADSLECPVCLSLYEDPKLLNCGHTICANCVNGLLDNFRPKPIDWLYLKNLSTSNSVSCPECRSLSILPAQGLPTNYRLVDLVTKLASAGFRDSHPCETCHKKTPVQELFTCKTCEYTFQSSPVWICSLCALKSHKGHDVGESTKATKEDREAARKEINAHEKSAKAFTESLDSRFTEVWKLQTKILDELEKHYREFSQLEEELGSKKCVTKEQLNEKVESAKHVKELYDMLAHPSTEALEDVRGALCSFLAEISKTFSGQNSSDSDGKEQPVRKRSVSKPKPPKFLKVAPQDMEEMSTERPISRASSVGSVSLEDSLKSNQGWTKRRTLARSGVTDFSCISSQNRTFSPTADEHIRYSKVYA
jgi:hypothetical protein